MAAERPVEVLAIEGALVRLRASGVCTGCTGCRGRCNFFAGAFAREGSLFPLSLFPRLPVAGESWRMTLPEDELRRQSLRGYGAALLGLVAGAALGQGLAALMSLHGDLLAACGALAGTLLALRRSKRASAATPILVEARSDSKPFGS